MLILNFSEFWCALAANIFGEKTTWVKAAARRGVDRAGHITFQDNPFMAF
jgi:hypothetical protein